MLSNTTINDSIDTLLYFFSGDSFGGLIIEVNAKLDGKTRLRIIYLYFYNEFKTKINDFIFLSITGS